MEIQAVFLGHARVGEVMRKILSHAGVTLEIYTGVEAAKRSMDRRPPALVIVHFHSGAEKWSDLLNGIPSTGSNRPAILGLVPRRLLGREAGLCRMCDEVSALPLDAGEYVPLAMELLGMRRRRRALRVPLDSLVTFQDEKGVFFLRGRDISCGGVFIEMDHPLEPGTPLKLSFELPQPHGGHMVCTGRVVRAVEPGQGRVAGIGVRFKGLDAEQKRMLNLLAEQAWRTMEGAQRANAWPGEDEGQVRLLAELELQLQQSDSLCSALLERLQLLESRLLIDHWMGNAPADDRKMLALDAVCALSGCSSAAFYRKDSTGLFLLDSARHVSEPVKWPDSFTRAESDATGGLAAINLPGGPDVLVRPSPLDGAGLAIAVLA
ncbi:MAG: hypothetical protein D6806_04105, partial [Deltaproteobacteria bacterium]